MTNLPYVISLFVLWAISVFAGYYQGSQDANERWEKRLIEANTENLKEIKDTERKAQIRQQQVVSKYLNQIKEMQHNYEMEISSIKADHLRDTATNSTKSCGVFSHNSSKTVSRETSNRPNTICYTESELLSKVKNTLGIGAECDKLAERYKTLLEVCK